MIVMPTTLTARGIDFQIANITYVLKGCFYFNVFDLLFYGINLVLKRGKSIPGTVSGISCRSQLLDCFPLHVNRYHQNSGNDR